MSGEAELLLVPTKCTQLCQNKRPPFQAVVHASDGTKLPAAPKPRQITKQLITENDERPELDMKRVRYEVMKFGRSSLGGLEREQADVELAVSLGALPPRRKCINYKELLKKKKETKETEQIQNDSFVKMKNKLKKGNDKNIKGKKAVKKGILESYGKATSGKVSKKVMKGKGRK